MQMKDEENENLNQWGRTMQPGWANRNRKAVGLPPLPEKDEEEQEDEDE